MRIGIPNEAYGGETRVSLTPDVLRLLLRDGHEALVETGAGARAHIADAQYIAAGAHIVTDALALYEQSDAVFKVRPLGLHPPSGRDEAELMREGAVCLGLLAPLSHLDMLETLARRHITSYAVELIPRISRAQGMDALTAMATVAGYKAVLLAADRLDRMLPLMMTAAGTIAPATVLVLGAGVAGLQAIATAKRLGARVEAFDPRPTVREQVQSLGASFLDMDVSETIETTGGYAREQSTAFLERECEVIARHLPQADIVICTAQVFGKPAPLLITAEMVGAMRAGAVIVDLAAEQGGNCALTQPEVEIKHTGVTIVGAGNLPALVPFDASQLYAHTVVNLFRYLYPHTGPGPDDTDEIVRATCVTRGGEIVHPDVREAIQPAALATAQPTAQQGVPA